VTALDIRLVNPTIGAEITGVDLRDELDEQVVADLRQALLDHHVLFFRDQDLTVEQHLRFGRYFGDLHVHPAAQKVEGHPELLRIHADETSRGVAGQGWHSDVSCDPEPPDGSILKLHQVPSSGGDTMFSNCCAAFDTLSPALQGFLSELSATHSGAHVFNTSVYRDDREYPESVHPVVRTHPESGRQALFVNRGFTTRINELAKAESDAMLEFLYRHVEQPVFQCRFRWEPNSIAFWDNRSVQHYAVWDYFPEVRSGWRVTLSGTKPFHDPDGVTGEPKRGFGQPAPRWSGPAARSAR
jgi:taurine dioxygenase